MEKLDHPQLHKIFQKMLKNAPSINEEKFESPMPLFHKELEESIKSIPDQTLALKPGIEFLRHRALWKDGARCHPIMGQIRGYSYAEIISGVGGAGLYHHDLFRLGLL